MLIALQIRTVNHLYLGLHKIMLKGNQMMVQDSGIDLTPVHAKLRFSVQIKRGAEIRATLS